MRWKLRVPDGQVIVRSVKCALPRPPRSDIAGGVLERLVVGEMRTQYMLGSRGFPPLVNVTMGRSAMRLAYAFELWLGLVGRGEARDLAACPLTTTFQTRVLYPNVSTLSTLFGCQR